MKYIFGCISKMTHMRIENRAYTALFVHIALWFAFGSLTAWMMGSICQASKELIGSYILEAGSCLSLVIGYGGGVVWLLRHDED